MGHLLIFSRNRSTVVEKVSAECMRSSCVMRDTLTDARIEVTVELPDLEITQVHHQIRRSKHPIGPEAEAMLQHALGVRIGPGMLKIIQGLGGNQQTYRELFFMLEECCQAIILSFTKEVLVQSPRPTEAEASRAFYNEMVRENIRLYNRCAAFAQGSPLVEGIDIQGNGAESA